MTQSTDLDRQPPYPGELAGQDMEKLGNRHEGDRTPRALARGSIFFFIVLDDVENYPYHWALIAGKELEKVGLRHFDLQSG